MNYKAIAAISLILLCLYSSSMVGLLMHELDHKRQQYCTDEIRISLNGSGHAKGIPKENSNHDLTYLRGNLIGSGIYALTTISIITLFKKPKTMMKIGKR